MQPEHDLLLDADAETFSQCVLSARDAITHARLLQPQVAIVLGSGLGQVVELVQHPTVIPYANIPHFPCPSADGHAGNMVLGYLNGVPVAIMAGRCHRYEGCANAHVSFPIYCLRALGARTLVTTNAAGALNPRFQAGELMVLDSHIDLLWARRLWSKRSYGELPASRQPPYDIPLLRRAQAIARRRNIPMHQGCYLATLGPTYETRSEYRMFRWMGADAVGMSTVPEVLAARQLDMQVLAFSVITNVASTDFPQSTSHAEVVDFGVRAGPQLISIVGDLLEEFSGQPD